MEHHIRELKRILDALEAPDGMDSAKIHTLELEMKQVESAIVESAKLPWPEAQRKKWGDRLDEQVRRMPSIQARLLQERGRISAQLMNENRRVKRMRDDRASVAVNNRVIGRTA
ncbi:hypothetical protein Mmc1_0087 [Magnetococcus marinus MC-1]|uniref:Flagellar protein FliT n=1 Tax=Magnetococcus marinus (strain ATCC BAA-1437 / JCM 17883 / MC-1) TaxID=156889 RepID=A0L3S3_MAGMM|nr:hypothetical protein [Magnetococcus marinus]ABK42616.1 hypothetical protein Mmc1_0087 [Magnetococcus marinus MC-1]